VELEDILLILQLSQQISGIDNNIYQIVQGLASKAELDTVQSLCAQILARVEYLVGLNDQMQAQIATLQALLSQDVTAILTAVGNPQQAGQPVTLPQPPPAGYGADVSGVPAATWDYVLPASGGLVTGSALRAAGQEALNLAQYPPQRPFELSPRFSTDAPFSNISVDGYFIATPVANPANILPADTIGSWIQRENPTFTFTDNYLDSGLAGGTNAYAIGDIFFDMGQAEFDAIKATLYPKAPRVAPVWPGIANVTLGVPVALSPVTTVPGPLAGVIIDITAAAPRQSYGSFGALQGYRFTGALTFVDDNGDGERPQALGLGHEVILPKSMEVASSCQIRADVAVSGTATPFTIP
jgi:hypothetical protein